MTATYWRRSPATVWRRALKRADRRARAYLATHSDADGLALLEAVRLSNAIFRACVDRTTLRKVA